MSQFRFYNHLGFHNPYYTIVEDKFIIESNLAKMLDVQKVKTLDFTAIVQLLSTGYIFGDRTLIKEIKKTPWLAKPNDSMTGWTFYPLSKHQERIIEETEVANKLYELLKEELISYIRNHQNIGILLTGGMDSRIVAALLFNLLKTKEFKDKSVYAYTWGLIESRDVIYAKKIAELFNWDWKHLIVDKKQMLENFNKTIEYGCEFTPIHLHAIPKLLDEVHLDCVLAASFGDSIGRGEYSGVKVNNTTNLKKRIKNTFGILRNDYFKISEKDIDNDLRFYHNIFLQDKVYQQNELDLQLHYMRRMLNPCMSIINTQKPLYQLFTSPNVYEYMWSIIPEKRNDLIYKHILENCCPELLEIPWARTGLKYPEKEGVSDEFNKRHHDYGKMIRDELLSLIEEKINKNTEHLEKIFNIKNINKLIYNLKKYPIINSYYYEEKLLWIAALTDFIKKNNINVEIEKNKFDFYLNIKENIIYKAKYYLKR